MFEYSVPGRLARMRGLIDGAKGCKVGDNPYCEQDQRHWAWMNGWIESNKVTKND